MDEMELRNKMEFIVEQQAQFAVDIQLLRKVQQAEQAAQQATRAQHQAEIAEIRDVIARLANASLRRFEELEKNQSVTTETQAKTGEQMSELTQAQMRTQEHLDMLTVMLERFFSRGEG